MSASRESLSWLYLDLARHHYFRMLAKFTDCQVPSSAGFLSTINDPSRPRVFDPMEFSRPAQTRAFLELILAPIKWASCPTSVSYHITILVTNTGVFSLLSSWHVNLCIQF